MADSPPLFEPKVLVLCCNWCSYAASDTAGIARLELPASCRVVRVMCTGRVEIGLLVWALLKGADGVLVSGCHIGDCHYISGNEKAVERVELLRALLDCYGLAGRLKMVHASAGEGRRFTELCSGFVQELRELGPTPLEQTELDVDWRDRKRDVVLGLLAELQRSTGAPTRVGGSSRAATFSFGEPVFDDARCVGCGACAQVCPETNIEYSDRGGERLFRYLHARCVGCGLCEQACPEEAITIRRELDPVAFVLQEESLPVRRALASCVGCGQHFAPERQLAVLTERAGEGADAFPTDLCPACRRTRTTELARKGLRSMPSVRPE
jgi:F420-non-reducing hydrogenase iron-sulfur subunit